MTKWYVVTLALIFIFSLVVTKLASRRSHLETMDSSTGMSYLQNQIQHKNFFYELCQFRRNFCLKFQKVDKRRH